jgi:hypothetical protein
MSEAAAAVAASFQNFFMFFPFKEYGGVRRY